jgi:hypothetical protein
MKTFVSVGTVIFVVTDVKIRFHKVFLKSFGLKGGIQLVDYQRKVDLRVCAVFQVLPGRTK